MTALLELKEVSKQFGKDTKALSDISFTIEKGEFVSIIGPSGAGKSTLLRCINRMVEPTGGDIIFDGISVPGLGKKALMKTRTQIGMIFQHYNLVNRLTAIENTLHGRLGSKSVLAGMLGLYSEEEKQQAVKLLDTLGLKEQMYKRSDRLSGGQKQRVGIARALIQNPKMLLCDEPIASLDPNSSKVIMKHLRTISTELGITVLVNLHQVETALKYSDRIIGVNSGKIVYDGPPAGMSSEEIANIYGAEAKDLSITLGGGHAG
ncbi:phosphonate ABC transporter ATP-binding protein [Bacillus mangrovi]|uniref:Phosphonate ABC transporter ATP-binding protein n=1 Tax=Metabacillus mangrovi TaxID=1491830 RepID=A0A7X2V4L5_9BACI|nr:phosphonate ABC transporter ATP-binding protein [Metabacillus mangrovi]MTH53505.1 phosphonate ABC transporter ATP-binding protein [Metabacillus mangrovi]